MANFGWVNLRNRIWQRGNQSTDYQKLSVQSITRKKKKLHQNWMENKTSIYQWNSLKKKPIKIKWKISFPCANNRNNNSNLHFIGSCLKMDWAAIPKIKTNLYSVPKIIVFKIHRRIRHDQLSRTYVIARFTILFTDGRTTTAPEHHDDWAHVTATPFK